ncbi:hypothetical protein QR680_016162 [Steinernema hermaphroditum]|uniref:C3H1-type domain-containing protein n=1 Tax=Steinernema hermaphroditum TaxID=289476 RepID=A0AA39HBC4_9BILA|nr:hypothetical protein QR680_016162 [Steinernema hermaphroditum]
MSQLDIDALIAELAAMKASGSTPTYRPAMNPMLSYKTKLCKQMVENGACRFGEQCLFAHSVRELRVPAFPMEMMRRNLNHKYKTKLCNKFHRFGLCPYGDRCLFVHDLSELRMNKCTCTCQEHQQFHNDLQQETKAVGGPTIASLLKEKRGN